MTTLMPEPTALTPLTVHRNLDGKWLEEATFGAEAIEASAEPFVEVKVDLASIWALAPALPTE